MPAAATTRPACRPDRPTGLSRQTSASGWQQILIVCRHCTVVAGSLWVSLCGHMRRRSLLRVAHRGTIPRLSPGKQLHTANNTFSFQRVSNSMWPLLIYVFLRYFVNNNLANRRKLIYYYRQSVIEHRLRQYACLNVVVFTSNYIY